MSPVRAPRWGRPALQAHPHPPGRPVAAPVVVTGDGGSVAAAGSESSPPHPAKLSAAAPATVRSRRMRNTIGSRAHGRELMGAGREQRRWAAASRRAAARSGLRPRATWRPGSRAAGQGGGGKDARPRADVVRRRHSGSFIRSSGRRNGRRRALRCSRAPSERGEPSPSRASPPFLGTRLRSGSLEALPPPDGKGRRLGCRPLAGRPGRLGRSRRPRGG
jgi:hypothetical protein